MTLNPLRLPLSDALVATLYWQLALLGGVLSVDPANPIYATFALVAPVEAVGIAFFASAHGLLLAWARQRGEQGGEPRRTRALYAWGVAAAVCFLAAFVAYLVQFDFAITTAQAMYGPSAVACFVVASEGASPWA